MREILFRGKDPETGTWYEGFYLELSETTYCSKGDYDRHPDNTKFNSIAICFIYQTNGMEQVLRKLHGWPTARSRRRGRYEQNERL